MKIRELPANVESEKAVIGELLLNNSAWESAKVLTDKDFSLSSHRRIFACIRAYLERKRPIDGIILADALKRQVEFESVGGYLYVSDLTSWHCKCSLTGHIGILQEKARLRSIIAACQEAQGRAYAEENASEIAETLRKAL